jgi:hypothetical protein
MMGASPSSCVIETSEISSSILQLRVNPNAWSRPPRLQAQLESAKQERKLLAAAAGEACDPDQRAANEVRYEPSGPQSTDTAPFV